MYTKDLKEDLRLRLSTNDMDFLRSLSTDRGCSISECIRSIIGEYRRSVDMVKTLQSAINMVNEKGGLSNGDTRNDIDC